MLLQGALSVEAGVRCSTSLGIFPVEVGVGCSIPVSHTLVIMVEGAATLCVIGLLIEARGGAVTVAPSKPI